MKLLKYVTASDYFIMACEFIFCAFICYYYVEEALEIKKHKFSYFFSIWNNLDIIVLLVNLIFSIDTFNPFINDLCTTIPGLFCHMCVYPSQNLGYDGLFEV